MQACLAIFGGFGSEKVVSFCRATLGENNLRFWAKNVRMVPKWSQKCTTCRLFKIVNIFYHEEHEDREEKIERFATEKRETKES